MKCRLVTREPISGATAAGAKPSLVRADSLECCLCRGRRVERLLLLQGEKGALMGLAVWIAEEGLLHDGFLNRCHSEYKRKVEQAC